MSPKKVNLYVWVDGALLDGFIFINAPGRLGMADQCAFLSRNVRGLGMTVKCNQVFSIIRKAQSKIMCLQETHMIKDHFDYLKKPWAQW